MLLLRRSFSLVRGFGLGTYPTNYCKSNDKYFAFPKIKINLKQTGFLTSSGVVLACSSKLARKSECFCEAAVSPTRVERVEKHSKIIEAYPDRSTDKWKLLLDLMLKDWKLYLLATVASILSSLCTSSQAMLFGKLFDVIGGDTAKLIQPVKKLLTLFTISAVASFISSASLAFASNNLGDYLRRLYFHKVISLDISFFDEHRSTQLVHELTNDISELQSAVRVSFTRGVESAAGLLSGFFYMFSASRTISTALFCVLPPLTIIANSLGYFLRKSSSEVNRLQAASATQANEAFSNIKTVRSFKGEETEIELYDDGLIQVARAKRTLALSTSLFYTCLTMGINLIALSTIFLGGYLVVNGEISKGDIAAVVTQTQMIERSFARMSMLVSQLSKAMKNADNIFETLAIVPLVNTNVVKERNEDRISTSRNDIAVKFNNVRFVYPNRPHVTVLDKFNLSVERGEVVALVGPSGSGKSTTFSLLQKFYLPEVGEIIVAGENVRSLNSGEVHDRISVVSQEPVLFARSILENIRYAKPDASIEEVMAAAKKASAHEFIESFPDGYETLLGERGALLSGGQKQRIAIARAVLADSRILLLDEATSALDNRSEKQVQIALKELMNGRTTIIIAHRLSTIEDADRICVVENGQVVETGTHQELLAQKNSRYGVLFHGHQVAKVETTLQF